MTWRLLRKANESSDGDASIYPYEHEARTAVLIQRQEVLREGAPPTGTGRPVPVVKAKRLVLLLPILRKAVSMYCSHPVDTFPHETTAASYDTTSTKGRPRGDRLSVGFKQGSEQSVVIILYRYRIISEKLDSLDLYLRLSFDRIQPTSTHFLAEIKIPPLKYE